MYSPYRSTHAFSPTISPRHKHTQHANNMGTSVNIATAFSNSRSNSNHNFRHSEDEDNGTTDFLDISSIDHEAIRNDPELRELSRNPAAFNNDTSYGEFQKHTHILGQDGDQEEEEEDDDDDYGEFNDVEMLVRNPLEEKRQRQLVSQMSNVSSVQNVPASPRRQLQSELSSASTAFDAYEANRLEKKIADSLQFSDSKYHGFYAVLKPIVFLFFMAFWITKEPIIRTVTFFTMVVSTVIVDPLFYLWSRISSNKISNTNTRRNITHWCTAVLFGVLSIVAIRSFSSSKAILPAWATDMEFSLPFSTTPSPLSSLDRQQIKIINNEYKALSSRLGKFQDQFQAYTKGADSEHTKLWSAIHNQQAQISALHDKLDTELRELLASQQQKLPDNILISTDKDSTFELPANFYEHLHNADSWNQFLKQNKAAIDKYLEGHMNQYFAKQEKNGAIISKDAFLSLITNDLMKRTKGSKHDPDASLSLSQLVASAVEKYHQDMLDTADFALESRGGHVIFTKTSPTFDPVGPWKRRLRTSMGLSIMLRPPEMAIRPDTHAGACWSMAGQQGSLGITLSEPILIQGVTIEHPSKNILLHDIDSAPKDMEVYGISNYGVYGKEEELVSLGRVYYDINSISKPVQTFTINNNPTEAYRAILIKIKSNWGNPDHTDLYRIRVHGIPL
ncbi:SUN domain-containing protein 2 [Mucor ambiguus]|uniref:SUN domain-containing protein 2 n=1 Tax=Mucor ambiguus TaxID=91626 RepID=A0A0C9MIS9_9FUNG|nr:SUN domain-containing protein 2 [Mucor ambiguus]